MLDEMPALESSRNAALRVERNDSLACQRARSDAGVIVMLRFTNRIEALLLLASALTTLPMTAGAQNRRPQGRAAPAVRAMGPVRGIFRSACGAFRSACGPCASTASYATDCRASRTGAGWSKTPDRRTVPCCTDRRIASRRTSTAWRKRQFAFVHPARGHGWGGRPTQLVARG